MKRLYMIAFKWDKAMRRIVLGTIIITLILFISLWGICKIIPTIKNEDNCKNSILHEVVFNFEEDSYAKEREFVYSYYLKEYGEYIEEDLKARPEAADLFKLQLGIDTFDIDDDGDEDIMAYFQEHGLCGSHGCLFIIFRNDNGNYINMMSPYGGGITTYIDIFILKQKTNGVHDIASNGCPNLSIDKWDSKNNEYVHISEFKKRYMK